MWWIDANNYLVRTLGVQQVFIRISVKYLKKKRNGFMNSLLTEIFIVIRHFISTGTGTISTRRRTSSHRQCPHTIFPSTYHREELTEWCPPQQRLWLISGIVTQNDMYNSVSLRWPTWLWLLSVSGDSMCYSSSSRDLLDGPKIPCAIEDQSSESYPNHYFHLCAW